MKRMTSGHLVGRLHCEQKIGYMTLKPIAAWFVFVGIEAKASDDDSSRSKNAFF